MGPFEAASGCEEANRGDVTLRRDRRIKRLAPSTSTPTKKNLNPAPSFIHKSNMAEPTKAETEEVFKVLRAQKGNKVRCDR